MHNQGTGFLGNTHLIALRHVRSHLEEDKKENLELPRLASLQLSPTGFETQHVGRADC